MDPKEVNIQLDDLIKLSHYEITDYLIKRSTEDIESLDQFDITSVCEIISTHYEHLFTRELLNRYDKTIEDLT